MTSQRSVLIVYFHQIGGGLWCHGQVVGHDIYKGAVVLQYWLGQVQTVAATFIITLKNDVIAHTHTHVYTHFFKQDLWPHFTIEDQSQ